MWRWWGKAWRRERAGARHYEAARAALERGDAAAQEALAAAGTTPPEMLYYLAEHGAPPVRRHVAANPATPVKADRLLAFDADDEVRCQLARKIARLLPDLDPHSQTRLREQTVAMLEFLAADHLPRVRALVAEEIKRARDVPPDLVRRLARDVETIVAAPVLEYSPLLSDHDLREIIAAGAGGARLLAIARRADLRPAVADAVVATLDVPAVAALLANPSAEIRAETLERLAEQAEQVEAWHRPLVLRPDLSLRAARRIAGFVATALLEELARRHALDADTTRIIAQRVQSRLRSADSLAAPGPAQSQATDGAQSAPEMDPADERSLAEAAEAGRLDVVVAALAARTGLPAALVRHVIATRNGKAITALVWRAGLGMRFAVKVQQHLARIPNRDMVHARDGIDYPLTPEEMTIHLELFGVPAA